MTFRHHWRMSLPIVYTPKVHCCGLTLCMSWHLGPLVGWRSLIQPTMGNQNHTKNWFISTSIWSFSVGRKKFSHPHLSWLISARVSLIIEQHKLANSGYRLSLLEKSGIISDLTRSDSQVKCVLSLDFISDVRFSYQYRNTNYCRKDISHKHVYRFDPYPSTSPSEHLWDEPVGRCEKIHNISIGNEFSNLGRRENYVRNRK